MDIEYRLGIYVFITQLLGILAGSSYLSTPVSEGTLLINEQASSGVYLVVAIAIATGIMLLLHRFNLQSLIKAWFYTAILLTTMIFFSALLPSGLALGVTTAVFVVRQLTPSLWTRNIMDAFSYAGAGALFGAMIGPLPAAIFLIVLAAYDAIAVFVTGHMVSIAEDSIESNTFMGIMYPKNETPEAGNITVDAEEDTASRIGVLGGGDIVAPTLYSISLLSAYGSGAAILSALGATTGLIYLFHRSQNNSFYPAIPFIAAGCFAGTATYFILTAI